MFNSVLNVTLTRLKVYLLSNYASNGHFERTKRNQKKKIMDLFGEDLKPASILKQGEDNKIFLSPFSSSIDNPIWIQDHVSAPSNHHVRV